MDFFKLKIFALVTLLALVTSFTLSSCHSTPVQSDGMSEGMTDVKQFPGAKQLTFIGLNREARFAPSGEKLIFISAKRPAHQNPQIYLYDMKQSGFKRLTFQAGENSSPQFSPDESHITYVSTMDAGHEIPNLFNDTLQRLEVGLRTFDYLQPPLFEPLIQEDGLKTPTELYVSDLNGRELKRLTQNDGFDGAPTFHPNGESIFFASKNNNDADIFQYNLRRQKSYKITKQKKYETHPSFSPKKTHLAYVEINDDQTSHLMTLINGKTNEIQLPKGLHMYPIWSRDESWLLFSSNMREDNFDLYRVRLDGTCLQRLTRVSSFETFPDLHPNGNSLIFTSDYSGEQQIYEMQLPPSTTCESSVAQR